MEQENDVEVYELIVTNTTLIDLVGDPLFKVIEFLDEESISNLCSINDRFGDFCRRKEFGIYTYLLARDFKVPAGTYSRENVKPVYKIRQDPSHWIIEDPNRPGRVKGSSKKFQAESNRKALGGGMMLSISSRGRELFTYARITLVDFLWSVKVNIDVTISVTHNGTFIVTRSSNRINNNNDDGYAMNRQGLVDINLIDQNTIKRTFAVHYDRVYPEILPLIFKSEISSMFNRENINYPDVNINQLPRVRNLDRYESVLDLMPEDPNIDVSIYQLLFNSLDKFNKGVDDGILSQDSHDTYPITEAQANGVLEVYVIGERFKNSYMSINKRITVYLVYFLFKITGAVKGD